jgi:hypothetical protein
MLTTLRRFARARLDNLRLPALAKAERRDDRTKPSMNEAFALYCTAPKITAITVRIPIAASSEPGELFR